MEWRSIVVRTEDKDISLLDKNITDQFSEWNTDIMDLGIFVSNRAEQ